MFPLGTVLFPHAILPAARLRAAIPGDDARRARTVIRSSVSCSSSAAARSAAATSASVSARWRTSSQASELPDGRYALAAVGRPAVSSRALASRRPVSTSRDRRPGRTAACRTTHALIDPVVAALREVYDLAGRVHGTRDVPDVDGVARSRAGVVRDRRARVARPARRAAGARASRHRARLAALAELLSEHAAMLRAQLDEG